jgi:hypothetical protein
MRVLIAEEDNNNNRQRLLDGPKEEEEAVELVPLSLANADLFQDYDSSMSVFDRTDYLGYLFSLHGV